MGSHLNNSLTDLDPDINYYDEIISENHVFSSYNSVNEFLNKNPIGLNDNKFISIFNQNIRSFNSNLDTFLNLFNKDNMPDVFVFSETWHDANRPVIIPGYVAEPSPRNVLPRKGIVKLLYYLFFE